MNPAIEHPAESASAVGQVCTDVRCATLLDSDAEICDECGGTQFRPLASIPVRLCGWAETRPVVFAVATDRPTVVGRSATGEPLPDVDLRRFPGGGFVHRRHARIELDHGEWRVTQLGTNPLVVVGRERVALEPGATAGLRAGDVLLIGDVVLRFCVVPDSSGHI